MSIICEIDQILVNSQDYFILKNKEFEQFSLIVKENQVEDSEKFPLYSKEKIYEYED